MEAFSASRVPGESAALVYCDGSGICDITQDESKGYCADCYYCNDANSDCDLVPVNNDPNSDCGAIQCDAQGFQGRRREGLVVCR